MANPFLGFAHSDAPVTDHYGDVESDYFHSTPWHLAGICLAALILVVVMQMSGFRAMVGIGRN